jgi:hypothetical protein
MLEPNRKTLMFPSRRFTIFVPLNLNVSPSLFGANYANV